MLIKIYELCDRGKFLYVTFVLTPLVPGLLDKGYNYFNNNFKYFDQFGTGHL